MSDTKRYKAMSQVLEEHPERWVTAWLRVTIEVKKSMVVQLLTNTPFHLKPSLEEVVEYMRCMCMEFFKLIDALQNHGLRHGLCETNLCFMNFLRDLLEIKAPVLIMLRKVLAECKCCEEHMTCRQRSQEKKLDPSYGGRSIRERHACQCACRHSYRILEQALTYECPLEIKGQLWQPAMMPPAFALAETGGEQ